MECDCTSTDHPNHRGVPCSEPATKGHLCGPCDLRVEAESAAWRTPDTGNPPPEVISVVELLAA